jgi:hypothetical protein
MTIDQIRERPTDRAIRTSAERATARGYSRRVTRRPDAGGFPREAIMKIEFMDQGADVCPLVRLFDYRPAEVNRLRQACNDLADGRLKEFALHDQPWVEPIAGSRFYWRAALKDFGVRMPSQGEPLVLEYSGEAWREVEEKLAPFAESANGFNWLTMEGDVRVLISMDGDW